MTLVNVTFDEMITIITINRPDVRNAINQATGKAIREAIEVFEADDSQRVCVLTGGDSVFCAGADLTDVANLAGDIHSNHGPLGFTRLQTSKPTIAAIAGYAVAGGLEVACWCDLRVTDETAVFGCFERRFGVPLVDGGTQRLPRIIGLGRALELILTGRAVDAHESHRIGLANEVVPKGEHIQRAVTLGKILAGFPQSAMLNDRQAVYAGLGTDVATGLQIEAEWGEKTIDSGEPHSGAESFVQGKGRGGEFEK